MNSKPGPILFPPKDLLKGSQRLTRLDIFTVTRWVALWFGEGDILSSVSLLLKKSRNQAWWYILQPAKPLEIEATVSNPKGIVIPEWNVGEKYCITWYTCTHLGRIFSIRYWGDASKLRYLKTCLYVKSPLGEAQFLAVYIYK